MQPLQATQSSGAVHFATSDSSCQASIALPIKAPKVPKNSILIELSRFVNYCKQGHFSLDSDFEFTLENYACCQIQYVLECWCDANPAKRYLQHPCAKHCKAIPNVLCLNEFVHHIEKKPNLDSNSFAATSLCTYFSIRQVRLDIARLILMLQKPH